MLAVVTLAAAFAIDAQVFNDESLGGGLRGSDVPVRAIIGGSAIALGIFLLVDVCLVGLLVARLRNAPAGRCSSPASAAGCSPTSNTPSPRRRSAC